MLRQKQIVLLWKKKPLKKAMIVLFFPHPNVFGPPGPPCLPPLLSICIFLQAGNHAAARLGLRPVARVLPVEPDEPHVTAAKELLRFQQQLTTAVVTGAAVRRTGAGPANGGQQQQQRQQQVVPSGGSSSRGGWADDGTDSERRARESHRLRQLLKEEMAEQVAEQEHEQQQMGMTARALQQ